MRLLAILFVIFSLGCKEDLKITPMWIDGDCSVKIKEKRKLPKRAERSQYLAAICFSPDHFGIIRDHHQDLHDRIDELENDK